MDIGTSLDYLKAKIDRSREDLTDARDLFQQEKYRLSINRAYYAVFHIISATLAAMGQERRKHSSVEAAFHQYLIKSGLLEPEYGVTYKLARKWREDADYAIDAIFTEEIAGDILEQCEFLAKRVERHLFEAGFFSEKDLVDKG